MEFKEGKKKMDLQAIKGERALEVLADIIEPALEIIQDDAIVKYMRDGHTLKAVQVALRSYKSQVIEIMATLEGKTSTEYANNVTLLTLPVALLRLFNDPDIIELLFQSQGQMMGTTSSGSATPNTEVHGN